MPPRRNPLDEELESVLLMTSALAVEEQWSRLLGAALAEYSRLYRQGLGVEEIARRVEEHLSGLSTKADELLARESSTVAYGEGRAVEIVAAKRRGEATYALRSEVLDEASCATCVTLDGTVVEIGSADFSELKPPAKCDGRERCRGFYIAVGNALS